MRTKAHVRCIRYHSKFPSFSVFGTNARAVLLIIVPSDRVSPPDYRPSVSLARIIPEMLISTYQIIGPSFESEAISLYGHSGVGGC